MSLLGKNAGGLETRLWCRVASFSQCEEFGTDLQPGPGGRIHADLKTDLVVVERKVNDTTHLGEPLGFAYCQGIRTLETWQNPAGGRFLRGANENQMARFWIVIRVRAS